mmetsp:Transcript_13386/g.30473  ORF Transcript_13386/g.30473 Transcript_13386/m.30473 type:complete len:895 (-) Transcript_13386:41-2725(-)
MGNYTSCCGVGDEGDGGRQKQGAFLRNDSDEDSYDAGASSRENLILLHEKAKLRGGATRRARRTKIQCAPLEIDESFDVPSFPKSESTTEFLLEALDKNFIFDSLDAETKLQFVGAMELEIFDVNDEWVVHQGDEGDYFYVVDEGEIAFHVDAELPKGSVSSTSRRDLIVDDVPPQVGTGSKGCSFGELALLYNTPRAASIRALTSLKLYKIDQLTFRSLVISNGLVERNEVTTLLRSLPALKDLDDSKLQKLVDAVVVIDYKEGDRIVNKGDSGSVMYIVKSGEVMLTDVGHGNARFEDHTLGAGRIFGERALSEEESRGRAANVDALTNCTLIALSKGQIEAALGTLEEVTKNYFLAKYLRTVPILHNLTFDEIERCVRRLTETTFKQGDQITSEGSLFIIQEGHALMMVGCNADDEACRLVKLERDDYFGNPFVKKRPSQHQEKKTFETDTIRVESLMRCLVITSSDIELVIGGEIRSRLFVEHPPGEDACESAAQKYARMRRLSSDLSVKKSKSIPKKIKMSLDKLDKHRILGVGSFGQVWLVTRKDSIDDPSKRTCYALKMISKRLLISQRMIVCAMREKNVMDCINHPLILHLVTSFQDADYLYFVEDLIQGSELFDVLYTQDMIRKPSNGWKSSSFYRSFGNMADRPVRNFGLGIRQAVFYSACVIEAFSYLHNRRIAYRDLKPENVMIDSKGYCVVVDLGFAKVVPLGSKTFTMCGTPEYIPPETIASRGHDHGSDYWSFGCLLYELVSGETPFQSTGVSQLELFKNIIRGKYTFPSKVRYIDEDSADPLDQAMLQWKDLVSRLLVRNPWERLGNLRRGVEDILEHGLYLGVDLNELRGRKIPAPFLPDIKDPDLSSGSNGVAKKFKPEKFRVPLSDEVQELFKGF